MNQEWRVRAACRGLDSDLFFPFDADDEGIAAAKAICAVCPVAAECLETAMLLNEQNGLWGGMTEEERRKYRRRWNRPSTMPCKSCGRPFPRAGACKYCEPCRPKVRAAAQKASRIRTAKVP